VKLSLRSSSGFKVQTAQMVALRAPVVRMGQERREREIDCCCGVFTSWNRQWKNVSSQKWFGISRSPGCYWCYRPCWCMCAAGICPESWRKCSAKLLKTNQHQRSITVYRKSATASYHHHRKSADCHLSFAEQQRGDPTLQPYLAKASSPSGNPACGRLDDHP